MNPLIVGYDEKAFRLTRRGYAEQLRTLVPEATPALALDDFLKFREDNKDGIAAADALLDGIWGLLSGIGIPIPRAFGVEDAVVTHLQHTAYGFESDASQLDITGMHTRRWEVMLERSFDRGVLHNAANLLEQCLYLGTLFDGDFMFQNELWVFKEKISDIFFDFLGHINTGYTLHRNVPGGFEAVVTRQVIANLRLIFDKIVARFLESPDEEYGKLQLRVAAPDVDINLNIPEGFKDVCRKLGGDVTLRSGFKRFLLLRTRRRFDMSQYVLNFVRTRVEYRFPQIVEAYECPSRAPVVSTDRGSGIVDYSMKALHALRLVVMIDSWLVFTPTEMDHLRALPMAEQTQLYKDQCRSDAMLTRLREDVQKRWTAPQDRAFQEALDKLYAGLDEEMAKQNRYLWNFLHPLPNALDQAINDTIWALRNDLPAMVSRLDGSEKRDMIHPVDYLLYYVQQPGNNGARVYTPIKSGEAINPPVNVGSVSRSMEFLLSKEKMLTRPELDNNTAVVALHRFIKHQEEQLSKARPSKRRRAHTLAEDRYFPRTLSGYMVGFLASRDALIADMHMESMDTFKRQFDEFGLQLDAELTVPQLVAFAALNKDIIKSIVPPSSEDREQFIALIDGAAVAQQGTYTVALSWQRYSPVVTRMLRVARVDTEDLLRVRDTVADWLDVCTAFRDQHQLDVSLQSVHTGPVLFDSKFQIESVEKFVMPDNVLVLDDSYFYAIGWMHGNVDQVVALEPEWMMKPHEHGVIPRYPNLYTKAYYDTTPYIFMRPAISAVRFLAFSADGTQLVVKNGFDLVHLDWDVPVKKAVGNLVARERENSFYDLDEPVTEEREPYLALDAADEVYKMVRSSKMTPGPAGEVWDTARWHAPLRSAPDGLYFFMAHNYYVPHGSPYPYFVPEILKTDARFADHEINNFVGYAYLTYTDNSYQMGLPPQSLSSCAALKYLQEHPTQAGVIEGSPFAYHFPRTDAIDMLPYMAAKFNRLDIRNPTWAFSQRMANQNTLHGRALHEQMVQPAGAMQTLVFHITHGLGHDLQLHVNDGFLQAENTEQADRDAFMRILDTELTRVRLVETDKFRDVVDFDMLNGVMADYILRLLDFLGFGVDMREWVEYRPHISPIRAQEMIMVFPFINMQDARVLDKLEQMLEYIPAVPQTYVQLLRADLVLQQSVYPLATRQSPFMFVADCFHNGEWNLHAHTIYRYSREDQRSYYVNIRAHNAKEPVVADYAGDALNFISPRTHFCAALINMRSKVHSQRSIESHRTRPATLNVPAYVRALIHQSVSTNLSNLDVARCAREAANVPTLDCGCNFHSMRVIYKCKAQALRLVSIIPSGFLRPFSYHCIMVALQRVGFSDQDLTLISRAILPTSDNEYDASIDIEDCMAPYETRLKSYLETTPIFEFVTTRTIAYFARQASPVNHAQWQHEVMLTFITENEANANGLDFLVAELTAFCMSLDYLSHPGHEGGDVLLIYDKCGYNKANKYEDGVRSIAARFISPVLIEKKQQAQRRMELAVQNDERDNAKAAQAVMKKWSNATNNITSFRQARDMTRSVLEILRESTNWEDSKDSIRCLWRCNNKVLWAQRTRSKVQPLDGIPEFKLWKSCRIDYKPDYSDDDPNVKNTKIFLQRLFRNPNPAPGHSPDELMEFVLASIARILDGEPDEKKINMYKGPGDNGKTRFQFLLKYTCGDYYVLVTQNFFVARTGDGSGPTPNYSKINGARVVVLSEPRAGCIFDGSVAKALASPEEVDFRKLFAESSTFLITMRFFIFTNHFTPTDGGGHQAAHRQRWIPMTSSITESSPDDEREQWRLRRFKPDETLGEKLKQYAETMLAFLVERYNSKPTPPVAETESLFQDYLKHTDTVHMFWNSCVEEKAQTDEAVLKPPKMNLLVLFAAYEKYVAALKQRREAYPFADFVAALKFMRKEIFDEKYVLFIAMKEVPKDDAPAPVDEEDFIREWRATARFRATEALHRRP